MDSKINLLKRAKTPQTQKKKTKRILNILSFLSLGTCLLVSLLGFLLNTYFAMQIKGLDQKIKANQVKINSLSEIEAMQWAINDRLIALEKIINEQKPYDESIKELGQMLPASPRGEPAEASISQILLGKNTFSVSVTSPKLSLLNQFIENLLLPTAGGKNFQKIILEGLNIDSKGFYQLNVSGEIL